MTDEQRILLVRELGSRFPYGLKVNCNGQTFEIASFSYTRPRTGKEKNWCVCGDGSVVFGIDDCKPYLRPMTDMTESEEEELRSIIKTDIESDEKAIGRVVDLLNSSMLDYRGLISQGLAIEAPAGMY